MTSGMQHMPMRNNAKDIWPHLPSSSEVTAPSGERRQPTSPLAAAMYPAHLPKKLNAYERYNESLRRGLHNLAERIKASR
jgi:hypothetical protein